MTAQHITLQIIPIQGNSIGAANLLVVPHGLSIPTLLYANAGLTIPLANPIPVDSTGTVNFWVADGSITYDGFLSGGAVVGRPQYTNLYALTSPQTAPIYHLRYFTIDLVPQAGGQLGDIEAFVYFAGTSSLAPIFQSDDISTPITNPVALTNNAYNVNFWADPTYEYDIRLIGDHLTTAFTIQNIWTLPAPSWMDKGNLWQSEPHVWAWVNPYYLSVKNIANVGQLYTGADLIRAAFRLIQVSSSDTTLTADEMNDGLESLNRMLDSWSADELTLYQIIRESFSLTNNQNPYTIGYGGDFNTSRPIKIVDAQLNLYNANLPVTYPMQVLQYDDYNSIRLKTLATNFPQYLYYNPAFPLGEILIYPVFAASGTSTSATITLSSWKPIDVIDCLDSTLSFPPGYWEALVFNLAIRMAEEYQFDIRPQTMMLAAQALKRIKQQNRRVPTLSPDAALMNTSQRRYNIYSDGYGA